MTAALSSRTLQMVRSAMHACVSRDALSGIPGASVAAARSGDLRLESSHLRVARLFQVEEVREGGTRVRPRQPGRENIR